jgi:hypothetical protein
MRTDIGIGIALHGSQNVVTKLDYHSFPNMVPAPKERRMGINVLVRLAAFPGLKSTDILDRCYIQKHIP